MSDSRSRARALLDAQRFEEAKSLLVEVCEKSPGDAQAWFLLGAVYGAQQAFSECAKCSHKAVLIDPGNVNAHLNLAQAYMHLDRPHDAINTYRAVIALSPDHAIAMKNIGHALVQIGSWSEAVTHLERVRALIPNDPEVHGELGSALLGAGRSREAIECFKTIIGNWPDFAGARVNLSRLLGAEGRYDEALAVCETALRVNPDNVSMLVHRGHTRGALGQEQEALKDYLRAVELAPKWAIARSSLLMSMNYSCDDLKQIFSAHLEWDAMIAALRQSRVPHDNNRDPARRLRIGYVSHDFFRHSVAYFFEPLLASHDANEVETYCYAHVATPDPVTGRLRTYAHHWRDIRGLGPDSVADIVRRDSIDILVDLGGHTAPDVLLVFARKPAPIQVSWLGYPNTTGMTAMDFRITDRWADPIGVTETHHTEKLVRLSNGFLCYRPFADAPPVSPSPALQAGCITFGSFNTLQKCSPEVVKVWASILVAIPGSRIMLKRDSFRHVATADRYRQMFLEAGVESDRVILHGGTPWAAVMEHLTLYSQIDVGLDTFPYNGTATTCEALWMGVPVVCLAGNRHAGRVGVSLLTQLGLTDLIADNLDGYVRIAVGLANDPVRLAELRRTLRQRMSASPLCDAKRFARDMEAAFRTMWRDWCES
jgi:predicted O-linked N-acetylglucosamine transferase (SPINDLY family)